MGKFLAGSICHSSGWKKRPPVSLQDQQIKYFKILLDSGSLKSLNGRFRHCAFAFKSPPCSPVPDPWPPHTHRDTCIFKEQYPCLISVYWLSDHCGSLHHCLQCSAPSCVHAFCQGSCNSYHQGSRFRIWCCHKRGKRCHFPCPKVNGKGKGKKKRISPKDFMPTGRWTHIFIPIMGFSLIVDVLRAPPHVIWIGAERFGERGHDDIQGLLCQWSVSSL